MAEETRPYFLHESSYVDAGAQVGVGTKIWHFCHVMSGAVIGLNPKTGKKLFKIEHEVRSMYHPMFGRERNFVNRNPVQNLQAYSRGRDALVA